MIFFYCEANYICTVHKCHFLNIFFLLRQRVLRISKGFDDVGSIQPHLIIGLFVAWVLVFLCLMKGVKSVGKVRMVITMDTPGQNFIFIYFVIP